MMYFIMAFTLLVLIIFSWLVGTRPAALYSPAEFRNEEIYERLITNVMRRAEDPKILSKIELPIPEENIDPKVPKDWFVAGSNPDDYDCRVDDQVAFRSKRSAYIKSKTPQPTGFATLMQVFKAATYRSTRLAMAGYAKSDQLEGWAGFWMRVDGADTQVLRFDNMADRAIKGSTGWTKYQVVLDIPENAENIAFGVLLDGSGQAWFDAIEFRTVGMEVPTTEQALAVNYPDSPANLSFEEIETEEESAG